MARQQRKIEAIGFHYSKEQLNLFRDNMDKLPAVQSEQYTQACRATHTFLSHDLSRRTRACIQPRHDRGRSNYIL